MDLTYGVNPNQSVEGMVRDFNKREAQKDAAVAAELEFQKKENMEPNKESIALVSKGRLNPHTGIEIPPTAKTRSSQVKQFGTPSQEYLDGYDQINWN